MRYVMKQKLFSWGDGEDDVLALASTVVIDMACHGDKQRH